MPIISFNVSESLRNFIKKMVHTSEYKNNSNVIRDALVRLMKVKGELSADDIEQFMKNSTDLDQLFPKLTGSILINVGTRNDRLDKKINKLESQYHDSILHKNEFIYENNKTITYILRDTMDEIQMYITELNSIEELKSFRYTINENEQ